MKKELRTDREVVYTERPPFPKNMIIELTNACNHHCIFCSHSKMCRPVKMCNPELTRKIMKEAYELGTREVGFYLMGEPFLNPDLEKYVSYAHELGYEYIYLTTNGALATIDKTSKVVRAGLNSIKFSINAATPETYEQIHGRNDFLAVKKNIADLREYVISNNLSLNMFISFVTTLITEPTCEKIKEEFGDIVDNIYFYDCFDQGGNMPELAEKGIVDKGKLNFMPMPCEMVFNRLHVTCEGYLDACCVDVNGMLAAVDLNKVPLMDAWYSEEMVGLRKRILERNLKGTLCYNCVTGAREPVEPLNKELARF